MAYFFTGGNKKVKLKVKHPDFFQLAAAIVEASTDENPDVEDTTKNPQAVASGRLGGKKGGRARAEKSHLNSVRKLPNNS